MEVQLSAQLRNEVTKWLNSSKKNIDEGLNLFEESGYKPGVCKIFIQNRNRGDIPKKLEAELRLLLRYYANPTSPIHQDQVNEFYQKHKSENVLQQKTFIEPLEYDLYPKQVKDCITEFRNLYTERSKMHNKLKKDGEGNSINQTDARALIVAKIDACSRRMDELWAAVDAWKANQYLPSDDLLGNKLILENIRIAKLHVQDPKFELGNDITTLRKQSDNWRTKIVKAKNRLKYQSDTKSNKENPMPAGPKRIKIEKRIKTLEIQKLEIDTKLAELS